MENKLFLEQIGSPRPSNGMTWPPRELS